VRGLLVRVERLLVHIHLVEHRPRPVLRIAQDVELPAARFLARVGRVPDRLGDKALDVLRLDAKIDRQDEHIDSFSMKPFVASRNDMPNRSSRFQPLPVQWQMRAAR